MTYLLGSSVGEFTISMGFMSWISLECFPTFECGCGTYYLGSELDFTVQRGCSVYTEEFSSVLDEWGCAKVSVDLGS